MQVLRFDAYFKQTVHESPNEHYRLRDVRVFYYLEDDSISVVEPMVENRSTLSLCSLAGFSCEVFCASHAVVFHRGS